MIPFQQEDPCKSCHYSTQACAYILDGNKPEDACVDKLRQLKSPVSITSHTSLHPQHCDKSCKSFERKTDDAGVKYLHCKSGNINIHYSWRMTAAVNGCASHSSLPVKEITGDEVGDICDQVAEVADQKSRKALLKMIIEWISENDYLTGYTSDYVRSIETKDLIKFLKSLDPEGDTQQ